MKHRLLKAATTAVLAAVVGVITLGSYGMDGSTANAKDKNPMVVFETTMGDFTLELYATEAPKSVKNFLWYVDNEFYDGLIFHRVIKGFMIQGGGFTKDMVKKQGNAPIENEADNGLPNERGTVAMARTGVVNSATSQFFINHKTNASLDHRGKDPQTYGYAVFGKVVEGMDVVDAIAETKVTSKDAYNDVPAVAVVINKAYRVEKEKKD